MNQLDKIIKQLVKVHKSIINLKFSCAIHKRLWHLKARDFLLKVINKQYLKHGETLKQLVISTIDPQTSPFQL